MQSAAFFRAEGTVVSRPALVAAAWMAANGQQVRNRFAGLGAIALAAPFALASPGRASAKGWMALKGTSADRLNVLGEEYWHDQLKGAQTDVGRRLLDGARAQNRPIVLISEHPACIAQHMAEHLGVDHLVCNHLQRDASGATGRLVPPVIGDAVSGQWAHDWAKQRDIDLAQSHGYGARHGDAVFLSAVGHPCAVRPDRRLRQTAHELSWPVVDA